MQWIKQRMRRSEEEGFTLIELMVVVLIIAILIAIAIPTFLGARERAQDRAAQSNLRNALTAAKTIFTDNEDYTEANATALAASEPSLTFGATSTDPSQVALGTPTASYWEAGVYSKSEKCFYISDDTQGPGTQFASTDPATGNDCTSTEVAAATITGDSW